MSVIKDSERVVLERAPGDLFWDLIDRHFVAAGRRAGRKAEDKLSPTEAARWRHLAMLALRENAGWPLRRIGQVFGHNRGHVSRCLASIKEDVRDRFGMEPEMAIREELLEAAQRRWDDVLDEDFVLD